jgi:aldehyde:ferredoxin oxidoreductase
MGIGYKVIWDEVPLDTHPYAEEAKAVFAVGPFTGSGVPCSGRLNISFLTNFTRGYSICDAHIGGHFGQYMKYAGYDAIIIEGRSATPVYLKIDNNNVTLENASHLWGEGTFLTNQEMLKDCGPEFTSLAIGPAGEHQVNYSTIHGSQGHSGGAGIGALLGSKNLKGIACRGTGSVKIADPEGLMNLNNYMLEEIIGGNNNQNVPNQPQSWAEFTHTHNGRWQGGPGQMWGANPSGPVDLGEQHPGDKNRIAYRSLKNNWHFPGAERPMSQDNLVKEIGCSHCPIRCYGAYEHPQVDALGHNPKITNTCVGLLFFSFSFYPETDWSQIELVPGSDPASNRMLLDAIGSKTADDLGLWENYMSLAPEFAYCMANGIFEPVSRGGVIPDDEWNEIRWDLRDNFDPEWIPYLFNYIAYKKGEMAYLGEGTYHFNKRWNLPDDFMSGGIPGREATKETTYNGFPNHHATEAYQASLLHNNLYNRDNMTHCITNWHNCGLPPDKIREIVEEVFGEGCWDEPPAIGRTPINESKIELARWSFIHKQWHDMSTLCDWMWPMTLSPKRERGYRGDLDLEGKFMTVVTGEDWDTARVHFAAEKVSAMLRVMTAVSFQIHEGATNLRETHDQLAEHWFTRAPGVDPFEPGANNKLDRDDWARSQDMFYERMGWDVATGIPTRATLVRLGLGDMADSLEERGLLPS